MSDGDPFQLRRDRLRDEADQVRSTIDAINHAFGVRVGRGPSGPTVVIIGEQTKHRVDVDGALWIDEERGDGAGFERVHAGPVEVVRPPLLTPAELAEA